VVDDGLPELGSGVIEIRNAGGGWIGSTSNVFPLGIDDYDGQIPFDLAVVLRGVDGYEGLTAYVILWIEDASGDFNDVVGVIIPADMPPVPDLPLTEWQTDFGCSTVSGTTSCEPVGDAWYRDYTEGHGATTGMSGQLLDRGKSDRQRRGVLVDLRVDDDPEEAYCGEDAEAAAPP
jgi:hypothetical protein